MSTVARRAASGLTLVEMLVVIVITALTATLVMQGIGQGLGLFQRVSADQGEVYHELMGREWLRQTLAASVANPAAGDTFTANARRIRLQTFRPLLGSEGVATEIEWSLLDDGSLEYREGDQAMAVPAGRGFVDFAFQDDTGGWHDSWPLDESRVLPRRVRIAGAEEILYVTLLTQQGPAVDPDEEAFESD